MNIRKLIHEHKNWKAKEPKVEFRKLGDWGNIKTRLDCNDIVITKLAQTSADTEQSIYLKIDTAEQVYLYLKELFEDEK